MTVTKSIHSQVWESALTRVRERSPATFDCWFAGVQFDGEANGKLHLRARDEFVRDWVRDHFQPALMDEFNLASGCQFDVVWIIDPNLDSPVCCAQPASPVLPRAIHVVRSDPEPRAPESVRPPALVIPLVGVNPKNTFANFVVGPSNQLAFAASIAASGGSGRRYNPLFLCGSTGLGKTHLLHAIAHRIHSERPSSRIVYGSADSFTNEYITALSERRMDEFRARYHQCDALLIDDIQSLAGRTQTQEEFFNTFNILHACDKQIVLAADKYPQQLDRMEQRLVSRFTWGLVADVQTPELETRVAIVRKKAKLENIDMSEDVAVLLAQTVQSNVRELEGMLIRLIAKSSLLNCRLDLAFAERELAVALPSRKAVATVERIQEVVCSHFHVEPADMLSKVRHRSVSRARHIAMFLCRQRLKCSFPEIGRAFANRDHTTVMSAVRKVQQLRDRDPELRAHLDEIERRLSSGE
jgi:chromosomal replication initiator protein